MKSSALEYKNEEMKMSPKLINKIEAFVEEIIRSPSKASAKPVIKKLEFMQLDVNSSQSLENKRLFCDLLSYIKEASGQVKEKTLWINNVKNTLNQLKLNVSKGINE